MKSIKIISLSASTATIYSAGGGLLHPLRILKRPWKSISLDFITDLSPSKGVDAILTILDQFTMMTHFMKCLKRISGKETTNLVMREVFRLHGLPNNTISDRGSHFVSKLCLRHLLSLFKSSCKLSSNHHQQIEGQIESTNQTLEQYLCCFISYQDDNWTDTLHFVKFAYNTSMCSSTTSKVTQLFHIVVIILNCLFWSVL